MALALLRSMAEREETIRAAKPRWLEHELRELLACRDVERGIEILVSTGAAAAVLADMGWDVQEMCPSRPVRTAGI